MATAAQWIEGARLRTLPLAIAPVLIGTGAALGSIGGLSSLIIGSVDDGQPHGVHLPSLFLRALLALVVSLGLQIGSNYANDYSDGIRGTDDDRVGPFRLTGSRAAAPRTVKHAAFAALGAGAALGVVLIALTGQWWLLIIGALAVLAAWYYTGGSRPYGYMGLGELFVFVFFGLVAVIGTAYSITLSVSGVAVLAAVAIGLLAVAILVVNNLRDIPSDRVSGKHTLAVRLGERRTRLLFAACELLPFALMIPVVVIHLPAVLVMLALILAVPPVRTVLSGASGRDLIPALGAAGRLELVFSLLLLLGLAI